MTDVTYMGQVNGTYAALSVMRPRNRGVIVNVCSAMSYRAIPLQSAYCGAKHAVKGFTESVMTELLHEGSDVKVAMIQLPGLNTPQFNWNLNKMPKHPMPVAPVFQPELPAKGIASWPSIPVVATCGLASRRPTRSSASGSPRGCSTSTLPRRASPANRSARTSPASEPTSTSRRTKLRTSERTDPSTSRPMIGIRCCGCPPTGLLSLPERGP